MTLYLQEGRGCSALLHRPVLRSRRRPGRSRWPAQPARPPLTAVARALACEGSRWRSPCVQGQHAPRPWTSRPAAPRGEAAGPAVPGRLPGPGGTGTRPGRRDPGVQHANRAARFSAVLAAVIGLVALQHAGEPPGLVLDEVRDPAGLPPAATHGQLAHGGRDRLSATLVTALHRLWLASGQRRPRPRCSPAAALSRARHLLTAACVPPLTEEARGPRPTRHCSARGPTTWSLGGASRSPLPLLARRFPVCTRSATGPLHICRLRAATAFPTRLRPPSRPVRLLVSLLIPATGRWNAQYGHGCPGWGHHLVCSLSLDHPQVPDEQHHPWVV